MPKSAETLTFNSWIMLFTIGLLIFLMNIDYTAVNLALIPISEEIGGELSTLQWLLSGYVLIWAALVVPAGRFADIYGKKFSLILGVTIFIIGSILTGFGDSAWLLIAGRLIQGFGAAIFSSPAYGLIFSSVPSKKQGMAMGFIGGAAGLGLAIGPTLAGWIIKQIGWRWLFYINVPLGILVILALMFYAAPEKKSANAVQIDWISVALLSAGLGTFFYALNQISGWGISDPTLLSFGLGGIIFLLLFVYRDRQQVCQTMPQAILNNSSFMSTVGASFLTSYCFSLVMVMMGLYLQNTLKLSSIDAGNYFLAMTLAVGILSPIGGKLADRMDVRIPVVSGYILTALALLILSRLDANSQTLIVCAGLLLAGLGLGIGFPSLNTGMFRTLDPSEINTGSAIFTMAMMLGNSVSVIASTSLVVMFGKPKLMDLIAQAGSTISVEGQQTLINVLGKVEHTPEQLQQFPKEQIPALLDLIDRAFLHGFSITLLIGMVFSILAAGSILKYLQPIQSSPQLKASGDVFP